MNNNSFNEPSANQLLRKRTEEENSPPQRKLPSIPSITDITTRVHNPNKQDSLAKANYHIKQSINTLMSVGIDPVPVIINAIMEQCPGCIETISLC